MSANRWPLLILALLCGILPQGCAALKLPMDSATVASTPKAPAPLEPASDNVDPFAGISRAMTSKASTDKASTLDGQIALARLSERRGETDQAQQIYDTLLKKAPQDGRLHHRLGVLAIRKSDFASAEEHLRKAESLLSNNADVFSDLGYCYYLQQRLPEAEKVLNRAIEISPDHAAATNNLALVLGAQGRFREAMTLFKRANTEAEAYANMGYVLAQHGDTEQAKEMYSRALTLRNDLKAAAQALLQIDERERLATKPKQARPEGRTAANESDNSLVLEN